MFHCRVCGSREGRAGNINQVFQIDRRTVLVENIPATICSRCGEPVFDGDVGERIRQMVRGEAHPSKSIQIDVFEFA